MSHTRFHTPLGLALALGLLLIGLAPESCRAEADPLAAVLSDLHTASFFTCHDVKAALPHGQIEIHDAVIAVFSGMDKRLSGILLGDVDVNLNDLPHGPAVLNLYREIDAARAGGSVGAAEQSRHMSVNFHAIGGYLTASVSGGAQVLSGGRVSVLRNWAELEQSEQQRFESMYLQSYSDGWLDEAALGQPGGPGVKLRDPKGKEVFCAMWLDKYGYHSGQESAPVRLDYRVEEDGTTVSLTDYGDNLTMFQHPWTREDDSHAAVGFGEGDAGLHFEWIGYSYKFIPETEPPHVEVTVAARFGLEQAVQSLNLVSAAWLGTPKAFLDNDIIEVKRQAEDPWTLTIPREVLSGNHQLQLDFSAEVPRNFMGVGYGGVYRFDTTPLWPGENEATQKIIRLDQRQKWTIVPAGLQEDPQSNESVFTGSSDMSTRNCMVVATKFPLTTLDTAWGKLNVYAPPEQAGSVAQMEHITAVGDMLAFYESLWGPWDPKATTKEQNVFLIPDEEGVQAFEDAGMVFILGGEQSYGSGNVSLPLVAHEVAHLWWGQGVSGPRWFLEGMANYGAAKFMEQYYTDHPGPGSDPVSYRRYLMNFSLGHQLPLPLSRLDALGDGAAVYHNSAAYLLTADSRLRSAGEPQGFDLVLSRMYDEHSFRPPLSEAALGEFISQQGGPQQRDLWNAYVLAGRVESSEVEDPTFRECVLTPSRRQYVELLRWLTPTRRKQGLGDYAGALYCALEAQKLRDEPKDRLLIAQLQLSAGLLEAARAGLDGLIADTATDPTTVLKARNSLATLYRKLGDSAAERAQLEIVARDGAAAGLLREADSAKARLAELGSS